jgi:diguanylate cyclase (GGDEF)-like protein/PAS domain S-box-containing protein
MGLQYYPQLWPRVEAMMGDLGALSSVQQAELVAARAAADRASHTTLALLIGLSMFAFLGGAATLSVLVVSVVRPLASLQESARAVASGNLEARAKVAGPEEVASLARDFNEMTDTLVERSALLEESEGRFRNVLEVSRDLTYKLNLQTRSYDYVSPSALRLTGFTFEELTDMGLRETDSRVHPDDLKQYKISPNKLPSPTSEHGPASTIEYRWRCKDGEYRWFSDNRALIRDEDGQPLATVGAIRDITEWKLAEEALRESEERFRLAINATKDGLWEWDIQTNQEFFSPRWCEIIGYSFDDPDLPHTYESWASRTHPDDYDRVVSAMTNHLEKGTRYDVDYRHRHKSGEYRWQNSTGQAVLDESGKPIRMVGCISDITDRKEEEEALRESEARYKALFAGAPEGMAVADLQTKQFRHANPAMCRMFGYTEEEFLRIGVTAIHPKESLSYVLAEFEAQARGEKLLSADLPCQHKDGSLFYADVNAIMVVLDGRRCNVGFFIDVTERKKAEEMLRESEARYRSIFESIQDVFYRTDAVGIITEISPSIERFGYTREALIGTQVLEVYEDPEERAGLLKALLERGEVSDFEIRLKTGDGRLISTSVSAHILRGPDGTPIGVEGILRDISDRKAAAEALREQARRDPLTGVLNHGAIVDEMRGLISTGEDATPWAVAMIDVDHLKVMNDTYGHQAGDAMLVAVATALSRDDALVGRYGGDEFVAILRGADRAAAEGYSSKATDALAGATVTDPQTGESVPVEASIGLAIYPEDGSTLADLIKVSDSAMYAIKRQRPVRRPSPRKHAPDRKAA